MQPLLGAETYGCSGNPSCEITVNVSGICANMIHMTFDKVREMALAVVLRCVAHGGNQGGFITKGIGNRIQHAINRMFIQTCTSLSLSYLPDSHYFLKKTTRCLQSLYWSFECPLISLPAKECGSILSVRVSPPRLEVPEPGMSDNWVWSAIFRGLEDLWNTAISPVQRDRLRDLLQQMQEYGFTG